MNFFDDAIAQRVRYYRSFSGRQSGSWHGFIGGMVKNRFEKGQLKLLILSLLKEKPRHGYDIIQELEKKYHGFYSPSPGSVYPILQLLEDQDLIVNIEKSGKKIYSLTDKGEKYLNDSKEEIEAVFDRAKSAFTDRHGDFIHEFREEIGQTAKLLFCNVANGSLNDTKKREKLHIAFAQFRNEIQSILNEDKA